ncbi:MAG: 3-deoxy-manno-octulosonate cytidylyltransferase [Sedimentisphaerales bacterium]|nr:3-deoxy-manno-octulosonate cytidylyltransferase [Sedimentisphaerales bacterium]
MDVIAVIPARYASVRFPGKLLACRTGKYLIQHVYEQVCRARLPEAVIIATDDERIGRACERFGADWRMTRIDHASGTDRIAEVAGCLEAGIIVNVQGDEPQVDPAHVDRLVECLRADPGADMATLAAAFDAGRDIHDPHVVKVVADCRGRALYFSRCAIPYQRDADGIQPVYRRHLGLYAYRREALLRLSRLAPTPLERAEKLEQLRALEHGFAIALAEVVDNSVGIDTPEQYEEFVQRYRSGCLKE